MPMSNAERQRRYRERKRRAKLEAVPSLGELPSVPQDGDGIAGLGVAGKRLWQAVDDLLELAEHERTILLAACRASDRLEQISAALADAPLVVINHRGDQVAHPLLGESRQTALLLARLTHSLGLPAGIEEETGPGPERSARRTHRGSGGAWGPRGFYQPRGGA
jgi:hypothetical protein